MLYGLIISAILSMTSVKQIKRILPRTSSHWVGDGFNVFPIFADLAFTEEVSPFLMFDYGAPKHFDPTSSRRGVGSHPHRGMETVTISLQGEVEHGDSIGNKGVIGPGMYSMLTAVSNPQILAFTGQTRLQFGEFCCVYHP